MNQGTTCKVAYIGCTPQITKNLPMPSKYEKDQFSPLMMISYKKLIKKLTFYQLKHTLGSLYEKKDDYASVCEKISKKLKLK